MRRDCVAAAVGVKGGREGYGVGGMIKMQRWSNSGAQSKQRTQARGPLCGDTRNKTPLHIHTHVVAHSECRVPE